MIDSLIRLLFSAIASSKDGLPDQYALVTLHVPQLPTVGRTSLIQCKHIKPATYQRNLRQRLQSLHLAANNLRWYWRPS